MIDLRYTLAMDRIREIPGENAVPCEYIQYFENGAAWFIMMDEEAQFLSTGACGDAPAESLRERNQRLYEEILPGRYEKSCACPSYAAEIFGDEMGPLLAALRYEIRCVIPFVYRMEKERVLIRAELFLEVYTAFTVSFREEGKLPKCEQVRSIIRQYLADYAEDEMLYYLSDKLVKGSSRIYDIIADPDIEERDLYLTGEYVTDNELSAFRLVQSLSQEQVSLIADTITGGFIRGFINGGKNLASKKSAAFILHLGFERILQQCVINLSQKGLRPIISSEVPTLFHSFRQGDMGYGGANPNPQYYYDHREDQALFLDESLRIRRIEGMTNAYRLLKEKTVLYAGPLVLETFGSAPFSPVETKSAPRYNEAQKKMCTEYEIKAGELYSKAVVAKDRSFTIIDFPMPEISGSQEGYREIFDAVTRINTLDNALYEKIQGKMIDALNTASFVLVKGRGANRTDLRVKLKEPDDPSREANFENCTADVNIPVGEVFTTPVLEGTEGVLHVTGVYLNGLYFKDLSITFTEGRVSDYSCGNFDSQEEGRKYIEENILYHHQNLPMGECAIGTNTEAYASSAKYGISDRLPILIAEKTGPHFAVGDTCYSRDEDNRVCNPDGREIIAKDNSVSLLRKTDPEKAYFGCHTDITIPYDELGEYTAVRADGTGIPILENGRFVLEGTQILNIPLDKMRENA